MEIKADKTVNVLQTHCGSRGQKVAKSETQRTKSGIMVTYGKIQWDIFLKQGMKLRSSKRHKMVNVICIYCMPHVACFTYENIYPQPLVLYSQCAVTVTQWAG